MLAGTWRLKVNNEQESKVAHSCVTILKQRAEQRTDLEFCHFPDPLVSRLAN